MSDYLTPDQRRRISTGLMAAQYDKPTNPVDLSHLDGTVTNRSELFPFAEYRQPDGSTKPGIAWPGLLSGELPQVGDRSPEAADQYGRAVLSNAMLMGAPKGMSGAPTNALGSMGGRLAGDMPPSFVSRANSAPQMRPPDINPLAAIRLPDGRIVEGATHVNAIMGANLTDDLLDAAEAGWMVNGKFMNRDQTAAFLGQNRSTDYGGLLSTERLNARDLGQKVIKDGDGWRVQRHDETIFGRGPNPVGGLSATANAMERPGIRATHVSPHNVDRFDIGKVGTGMGYADEGFGLYFSTDKQLLDSYAKEIPNAKRYDVNINADPSRFADWDILPKDIQDILKTPRGAQAAVQSGLPGVTVKGSGGNSHVVFDDNLIEILRKYGLLGMLGGGAANEMLSASPRPASPQYRPGDA